MVVVVVVVAGGGGGGGWVVMVGVGEPAIVKCGSKCGYFTCR